MLDRVPIPPQLLLLELGAEQRAERWASTWRHRRGPQIGTNGDLELLERALRPLEILARRLALLVEELPQFAELRPLQVRPHGDEALRHRVQRRRGPGRILPRQPDPQKVAALVHGHRERVPQPLGGVAQRPDGERDVAPRRQSGTGRHPPKAKCRADRVTDSAFLQSFAARPDEAEGPPRTVHHDPIPARTVRVAHRESSERAGPAALGCEIQTQLAGDIV